MPLRLPATPKDEEVQNHLSEYPLTLSSYFSRLTADRDEYVQRGKKCVELIFALRKFIPEFLKTLNANLGMQKLGTVDNMHVHSFLVWKQYSLPLLMSLSRQSTNASREVRHLALTNLQRILLGQHILVDESSEQADAVFNHVVFPLIDDLLRPQVFQRDPRGMPETRLRASALLCKVFMHLQVNDTAKQRDIRVLWIQILDLLDRLMNVDKKDQLVSQAEIDVIRTNDNLQHEAIPESLKNVLLVMNATDMLVPPSAHDHRSPLQKSLWDTTHERIERFLPGFLQEVLPTLVEEKAEESEAAPKPET